VSVNPTASRTLRLMWAAVVVGVAILGDSAAVAALDLSRVLPNYVTVRYTNRQGVPQILRLKLLAHGPAQTIGEFGESTLVPITGEGVTSEGQTITGVSGTAILSAIDPAGGTVELLDLSFEGVPGLTKLRFNAASETGLIFVIGAFGASLRPAEVAQSDVVEFFSAEFPGGIATKIRDTCGGGFPSSFGFTVTFNPLGTTELTPQSEGGGAPQFYRLIDVGEDGSFTATGTGTTFGDMSYIGIVIGRQDHRALNATQQLNVGPGLCEVLYQFRSP
jgi:hypothetical protein